MKSILLLFLCMPAGFLKAQDTSLVEVEYLFSFNTDSLNKTKVRSERMLLYVSKNTSRFVAWNIIERRRLIKEGHDQGKELGFSLRDPVIMKLQSNSPQIFKYRNEGYFNEVRRFFKNFYWKETLPQFDWKTDTATAVIGGYKCLSATAHFKGRNYTAWYAPDIPIADGPWKFCGLPGLILKITDSKDEVSFEVKSILKNASIIQPEEDLVLTTKKEYDKLIEASYDDPVGVNESITGITFKTTVTVKARKRPKPGNAIELRD